MEQKQEQEEELEQKQKQKENEKDQEQRRDRSRSNGNICVFLRRGLVAAWVGGRVLACGGVNSTQQLNLCWQ